MALDIAFFIDADRVPALFSGRLIPAELPSRNTVHGRPFSAYPARTSPLRL
jgi:hypothetical protein